jgi:hypothetical protein
MDGTLGMATDMPPSGNYDEIVDKTGVKVAVHIACNLYSVLVNLQYGED